MEDEEVIARVDIAANCRRMDLALRLASGTYSELEILKKIEEEVAVSISTERLMVIAGIERNGRQSNDDR
jgi:hypothetical protein